MDNRLDDCVLEKQYPQIPTSLQYLFMENHKSNTPNQYVQNMLFCLQGYGYEVEIFSESNSASFIRKINPNVTEPTMYLPAIVKEIGGVKSVVAQGIVYLPKE